MNWDQCYFGEANDWRGLNERKKFLIIRNYQ